MLPQVSVVGPVLVFSPPFFLAFFFFFFSNLCTGIARGSDGGPIMTVVYTQRAGGLGGNRRASSYKPYSRIGQAGAFQHSWSSPSHRGSILRMFQYQLGVCI